MLRRGILFFSVVATCYPVIVADTITNTNNKETNNNNKTGFETGAMSQRLKTGIAFQKDQTSFSS